METILLSNNIKYTEALNAGSPNTILKLFHTKAISFLSTYHDRQIKVYEDQIIYLSNMLSQKLDEIEKEKLLKNLTRLGEISQLQEDWDGYGAKPFEKALINKCVYIINKLRYQPEIYPTGRQSIQFQFELADRSYLEFEIYKDRTLCLIVPKRDYTKAIEKEISEEETNNIQEIVNSFYGRKSTEI